MIAHVVLFRPRQPLAPDEGRAILDAVSTAVQQCPSVRRCRVGRRALHGLPGYEQVMAEDYQFALILEFDDVQGLRAYLLDPAHARAGEIFSSAAAASLAYDYELFDLVDAKNALGGAAGRR